MKRNLLLVIAASVLLLSASQSMAQTAPSAAMPKVIWLYQESVRPAMESTHEKVEHGFAQFWAKAQVQPFLGLDSVSSTRQALFISGYNSFESFENDFQLFNKAANGTGQAELGTLERQEANLVNGVVSKVAVLQDELSYLPDQFMTDLPKSRYFEIVTMQVGQGKGEDFAAVAKFYRSAFEKGGYQQPFATYRIMFGAPGPTYLIILPMKTLKALDVAMMTQPALLKAMGEDEMGRIMKMASGALVSEQSDLYLFNPMMSNVSKDFAAADPEFWNPKPKPVTKPGSTTKGNHLAEKNSGKIQKRP